MMQPSLQAALESAQQVTEMKVYQWQEGAASAQVLQMLPTLAASPLTELLESAGYRIEGPGSPESCDLEGRYWWTLMRDGWGGCEVGDDFATLEQATGDAVRALLTDEDIDWLEGKIGHGVDDQFDDLFKARLAELAGRTARDSGVHA